MNILITSVGRRSYMIQYFQEALAGKGKVHAANSELTYALQLADAYFISPGIYEQNYIESVLNYCTANEIKAIISLFDIDLPILSKNRQHFEEKGIQLLISNYEFIQICNDKWKFYEYALKNDFKVPKTYLSLNKVKQALNKNEINFPLIVKPRWGMGSVGIFEVDSEVELDVLYQKVKTKIQNSYLKYESLEDLELSVIIQEKLKGEEWGVDVFNDFNGNYLTCVPKQKLAMRAGETDIAIVQQNSAIEYLAKTISQKTKHFGNLDIDLFKIDNNFYILEFNARFGGQYPFSHLAGVNFPKVIISILTNKAISPTNLSFVEQKGFKDFEVRGN